MKTRDVRETPFGSLRTEFAKPKRKKKTAAQRQAARHLELYGIVHYLLTEQKCPIIYDGRLAFVNCPGVSKESFKKAIAAKVVRNLAAMITNARKPMASHPGNFGPLQSLGVPVKS